MARQNPSEFQLYMRDINVNGLLSKEEEQELVKQLWEGRQAEKQLKEGAEETPALRETIEIGRRARQTLIECNVFLVLNLAQRYSDFGLPFLDLVQEGNMGLIRAIDKFDYRYGTRLSTYATYWIRQSIARHIGAHRHPVRLPGHQAERISKSSRVSARLHQELGREPSVAEIAEELDITPSKLADLFSITSPAIPLNVDDDSDESDSPSPLETLASQSAENPDTHTANADRREVIQQALEQTLTPRESHIIRARFGLRDGKPKTLQTIADRYGLTKERIRQIEKEALGKLRNSDVRGDLFAYAQEAL